MSRTPKRRRTWTCPCVADHLLSFFTWGWMAGVWIYSTEINPLAWRTKGVGLAVALQWLWDFVLLQVTPIGIANIGWK